jgi:hypothetical protein
MHYFVKLTLPLSSLCLRVRLQGILQGFDRRMALAAEWLWPPNVIHNPTVAVA